MTRSPDPICVSSNLWLSLIYRSQLSCVLPGRRQKEWIQGLGNPDSPLSRTSKVKRFMRVSASAKNPDEAALIGRIRAGDETAMADLYDRYSGIVYGVALRVLGNTTAAEDVLQEVFLQLWRNPQSFDAERGRLAPWLAVIARNRAIDQLRK